MTFAEITDALAPWSPLLGIIAGGFVAGFFNLRNRRQGNAESKTPTVQQLWEKQTADSQRLDSALEDLRKTNRVLDVVRRDKAAISSAFTGLRDVFLQYVERVGSGGSTDLTIQEHTALELPVSADDDIEDTLTT